MRKFLLYSSIVAVMGGCETTALKPEPTYVADASELVHSQAKWTEYAPDQLPETDWVRTFDDPMLPELVNEANQANPSIRIARSVYEAAIARSNIAGANRLPSITGSAGLSRTEYSNSVVPDGSSFGLGLDASWEVDMWGRIRDQVTASELDAAAAQADYAGARLAVTSQVALTWYDLLEARLLAELSVRDVETQERALKLTERRFEGGVAQSSDVRLARSAVANAQALKALRDQRVSALTRTLEVLLRRYPAEALQAASDLPPLPPLMGAGVPADVLTRRPDLLAAERRLKAAGANVDIARKALLPRISLSATLDNGAGNLVDAFDIDDLVARLAANLTQPIFNGGRLKADIRQQEALLRRETESYARDILDAYLEVENALDGEQRLAERETALRTSLEEAVQAERRLERRYSEGLASILQLLDAQSRRISAESQLITARKERLANRIRLYVALGGGVYGEETTDIIMAKNSSLSGYGAESMPW